MTVSPTTTCTYRIRPIDHSVVAQLRIRDDAGRQPRRLIDHEGGNALRCCLRLSRPGESVVLASYAPLRRWAQQQGVDPGAYDEVGPVFVHADDCGGAASEGLPPELADAPRMLRAYSYDGTILRGVHVSGEAEFDLAIDEIFADSAVAVVHARAVEFGCFTFEVQRGR